MGVVKAVFGFLFSRLLWTIIGLTVLSFLIWFYGGLFKIGDAAPLESDLARTITVGAIWILWLIRMLYKQIKAARANRMFVAELATAPPEVPSAPGAENVAEMNAKFAEIMDQMKQSKLGGQKFLREMPWYLIIGPPGTGKTTALRQSGLHFPIDLSDDLKGVGGTRNCDWFFTEEAVLVDTAGRYVQQKSDADADAAEWKGFLELLVKHRGRRALNGVILTLSVQELAGSEVSIREHGREIRKRLIELQSELGLQLPVYLMITKADLIPGFEPFFADLTTREREQVWGATLPTDARVDGTTIDRETRALQSALDERMVARMASSMPLEQRGAAFRFPSQLDQLSGPVKKLVDAVFGESRYEDSPWLRGFYLTSATQEGSPIDQMVSGMSHALGLPVAPPKPRALGEKRSFFLRNLLTEVIFTEAGLGTFDPQSEERRRWVFRGTAATAALVAILAGVMFTFSYLRYSGGLNDQERQLSTLNARLANVAARQAPTAPLDLDLALGAANATANAASVVQSGVLTSFGPSAQAELTKAQSIAYNRTLRNILEPRMVALLEATMWQHSRDPDFLLGAMKTYQMMTGLAIYDAEFIADWWQNDLPPYAPIDIFPTEDAGNHQLAAIARMANEETRIAPDPALVNTALESICTIPLAIRAYRSLLRQPQIAGLQDWIPAEHTGPNGTRVLTRLSKNSLRVGLPGAFTFSGFHQAVLPAIPEVAAQSILDRTVFEGGCAESSQTTTGLLEADILKLYYDDFVAKWDSFLRDVRLAPIDDLNTARVHLKDLSSDDSALKRLLLEVVEQTHLTRSTTADTSGASSGLIKLATKKLGKVGKLVKAGAKVAGNPNAAPALPGAPVANHFKQIRGVVEEVDGQPALLGDTTAALTALYNELQTVSAGANPQAELLARGGLPLLTGAIADQAQFLPSPINDWLRGIAGDTLEFTREAIVEGLSARWQADVMPFCVSATQGRYPFDQSSPIDVNIADFARLFGPGGLIASFTDEHLKPYIDTTTRPWSWRNDLQLDPSRLTAFENSHSMRLALFPGGAGPVMSFALEPKDLSANASRIILNLDGQTLTYFNAATRPVPMTWPGPDGTNMITMSFAPIDGSAEVITSQTGSWAFLRLIRAGRLSPTALPEVFRLSLAAGGHKADFDLRANSVDNPFDLSMFSGFSCPKGF